MASFGVSMMLLAVSWPNTFCNDPKNRPCIQGTVPSDRDQWTVHGLWPTSGKPPYPSHCDASLSYNESLIPLLQRKSMEIYWPFQPDAFNSSSVSNSSDAAKRSAFWAHEYNKHGTCGGNYSVPDITNQYTFFSWSLVLYHQYNPTQSLQKKGIVPNNDCFYDIKDILKAVGNSTNVRCKGNYLQELWMYFNFDYQSIIKYMASIGKD
eukprot:146574_1